MTHDNIHQLQSHQVSATDLVDDPLTELIRQGARKLIEQALQAELELLLEGVSHLRDDEGRRRVVRNGYLPEREIQTGIGEVTVKVPRVLEPRQDGTAEDPLQLVDPAQVHALWPARWRRSFRGSTSRASRPETSPRH